MEIKPVDQTVKTLLESFFYRVPRFQRPYSWNQENVADFWNDAIAADDPDYFIGSFVVYKGPSSDDTIFVVDGQQRLTTITLLLASLRDAFAGEGHADLAKGTQQLIERPDIDNHSQFVLQSETPYPFLQEYIQKFGAPELQANLGREQEALKNAFEFLTAQVQEALASIESDTTIAVDKKADQKRRRLVAIRDKVLRLQLILIKFTSEDDAYVIFETLNTRGKDLRVSDLVKNHLTRLIKPKNKHVDVSRQKWQDVLKHFEESSVEIDVNRFLHHAWLSREPYLPEKKLFKQIRATVTKLKAPEYLDALVSDSKLYRRLVDPASYKLPKERPLSVSLRALNLFRVVQPVPMLLSILRAHGDDRLSLKQCRQLLRSMENFHFQFSAVTAQRTGGGTVLMFALAGRELERAPTKDKAGKVAKTFVEKLRERLPSYAEFEAGIMEIEHLEDSSKQRQLVRYLLARIDEHLRQDATIDYDAMTTEHLAAQNPTTGKAFKNAGLIGNLILVPPKLNKALGNKAFDKKRAELKKGEGAFGPEPINSANLGRARDYFPHQGIGNAVLRESVSRLKRAEDACDDCRSGSRSLSHISLPESEHRPAATSQQTRHFSIALAVAFDLGDPVGSIPAAGELDFPLEPPPTMPEVSVTEHSDSVAPTHKIWAAGQISCMQTKAQPRGGQRFAEQDLRCGVLLPIRHPDPTRGGVAWNQALEPRH